MKLVSQKPRHEILAHYRQQLALAREASADLSRLDVLTPEQRREVLTEVCKDIARSVKP